MKPQPVKAYRADAASIQTSLALADLEAVLKHPVAFIRSRSGDATRPAHGPFYSPTLGESGYWHLQPHGKVEFVREGNFGFEAVAPVPLRRGRIIGIHSPACDASQASERDKCICEVGDAIYVLLGEDFVKAAWA